MFDLSDCHLKECPSGVFVLCKVLRKEALLLHRNQLTSLRGGGQLGDLSLIRVLDLRENQLKSLPDTIADLTELRELFLAHNRLELLPSSLHRLAHLEILDVAHNQLTSVAQIKQLASLRVLLLNGNVSLRTLPAGLATCDSLIDLVVDSQTIDDPPPRVCDQGTKAILNYLMGALNMDEGEVQPVVVAPAEESLATKLFLEQEQFDKRVVQHLEDSRKELKEQAVKLIASERMALEKTTRAEEAVRHGQEARRLDLVRQIRAHLDLQDSQISDLNSQRNENRSILIREVIEEEERWRGLVQQHAIEVKAFAVDPWLVEQEAEEQRLLLDQVKVREEALRKQEILRAMEELLATELQQVEVYQRQKAASSNEVLSRETEKMNGLLADVFEGYNRDKGRVVDEILSDETVQRSAVAALIGKKDARSWALVEQMRIIESHLAVISAFEMDRRREGSSAQLDDLAERRLALSAVLVELMAQQEVRRGELVEMLTRMERERDDGQDFWLVQYQRLLDTQPGRLNFECRVDAELGGNLLANGVVHCLPFLTRLWRDGEKPLEEIGDEDLRGAGVRGESDRRGILKSIREFLEGRGGKSCEGVEEVAREAIERPKEVAEGVTVEEEVEEKKDQREQESRKVVDQEEQLAECVICMDKRVSLRGCFCEFLIIYFCFLAGANNIPAVRTFGLLR